MWEIIKLPLAVAYFNDIVVGGVCCRVETEVMVKKLYIMILILLVAYRKLGVGMYFMCCTYVWGSMRYSSVPRLCLHTSQTSVKTRAGCIWDAHEMCQECTRDASVQAQNLTIKLQQDVREFNPPFWQTGMPPEWMRDVSEMRAGRIWNACERYSTLELSCALAIVDIFQPKLVLVRANSSLVRHNVLLQYTLYW